MPRLGRQELRSGINIGTQDVCVTSDISTTSLSFADNACLLFGTGCDVGFQWATGDASNHVFELGLGASKAFHVTNKAQMGTDWNLAASCDPTLFIHANCTPTTDYLALSHNNTSALVNAVGGTLALQVAGTTQALVAACALTGNVVGTGASQIAAGNHSHCGGALAASAKCGSAGTCLTGNQSFAACICCPTAAIVYATATTGDGYSSGFVVGSTEFAIELKWCCTTVTSNFRPANIVFLCDSGVGKTATATLTATGIDFCWANLPVCAACGLATQYTVLFLT